MELHRYEGWITYTPEALNNRDHPKPMTIEIKVMNAGEWRKHSIEETPHVYDADNAVSNYNRVIDKEILSRTRNIKNLVRVEHGDDGEKKIAITDAESFNEHAPEGLRLEIYKTIVNHATLSAEDKKK